MFSPNKGNFERIAIKNELTQNIFGSINDVLTHCTSCYSINHLKGFLSRVLQQVVCKLAQ